MSHPPYLQSLRHVIYQTNFPDTRRRGVVAVLFAIVLPVLLLLSVIAINLAQIQLTRTELKIATDASARAGGRAWSEFNDLDQAKSYAKQAAALNNVAGSPLSLSTSESAGDIVFGESIREGVARYSFNPVSEAQILDGARASGIQVNATHATALLFKVGDTESFTPKASSVATQLDRDIALIIDRSGSMFSFEGLITDPGRGEDFMFDTITALYNDSNNEIDHDEYLRAIADYQDLRESREKSTLDRVYSDRVLNLLSGDLLNYALSINSDYHTRIAGPKFSRWHGLELAYSAFFDVLEMTSQEELVSVVSFASDASLEVPLTSDLAVARAAIDNLFPRQSTAIGEGMLDGFDELNVPDARLGAVKTLIVMTDGISKKGIPPINAANNIVRANSNVVINAVTFGAEADIDEMAEVARIGSGRHYHASNAAELIAVFRELAVTHRTLITD